MRPPPPSARRLSRFANPVASVVLALTFTACGATEAPEPRSLPTVAKVPCEGTLEKWLGAHQSPDGRWEAAGFDRWRSGERVPAGDVDGLGRPEQYEVGGEEWKGWNDAVQGAVVQNQRMDTDYCRVRGSWDPIDAWGEHGGRVYATAVLMLVLNVYYHYDKVMCDPCPSGEPCRAEPLPPADHSAGRVFAPCRCP